MSFLIHQKKSAPNAGKREGANYGATMSNHSQSKPARPSPSRHRVEEKGQSDLEKEALAYLSKPDLLNRCVRDIQAGFGIAGESQILSLAYLAITSRRLPDPLSLIVQGESGSGKTYALDSVCELVPPEELVVATHLSAKALYYYKDGDLCHKVLYGKERSRLTGPEQQEATRALRQLISDKQISNLTVSTEQKGQALKARGPIAYLETTTLKDDDIFDEDQSRLLLLRTTTDESHRRKVLLAIGARFASGHAERDELRGRSTEFHRLIQSELLRSAKVEIPFQKVLAEAFPTIGRNPARLFERVLFTVATVAYLYQYQRERTPSGAILATPGDYEVVLPILNPLIASSLCQGLRSKFFNDPGPSVLREVIKAEKAKRSEIVSAVCKATGYKPAAVQDTIAKLLAERRLIEICKQRGNKPSLLSWPCLPPASALTPS